MTGKVTVAYETIKEKIKVLAVFKNGTIFPYIFEWNNRRHKVDKVNLSYQEREGNSVNYYFAIESTTPSVNNFSDKRGRANRRSNNLGFLVAKLKYNDKSMIWSIEEVWAE